jgi:hypothetical protein
MKSLSLVLLLFLTACLPARPTATEAIPLGDLRYRETFDGERVWETAYTDTLTATIVGGVYRMTFSNPDRVTALTDQRPQTDSIIEATAYVFSDDPTGYYGIGCRANDNQRGYLFLVSVGGDFTIRRSTNGGTEALVKWQDGGDVIATGANAQNILKAVCVGDRLAFYVNNRFLAEVRDTYFVDGATALAIGVAKRGTTDVTFDDVQVWGSQ